MVLISKHIAYLDMSEINYILWREIIYMKRWKVWFLVGRQRDFTQWYSDCSLQKAEVQRSIGHTSDAFPYE